ncbi:MAG: hypothetical protein U0232_20785 [Thermomicrobiales bacterium]
MRQSTRGRREMGRAGRALLALLVAALLLPTWLQPERAAAYSAGLLNWPGGETVATFGANATIAIDLGKINYVRDCLAGPRDYVYPAADVYVVVDAGPEPLVVASEIKFWSVTHTPNATVTGFSDGTFTDDRFSPRLQGIRAAPTR